MAKKPRESPVEEGQVRVHDPFELVRWLALSQPDPRKALAAPPEGRPRKPKPPE